MSGSLWLAKVGPKEHGMEAMTMGERRIRQQFRERGELSPMKRGDGPTPKVGPTHRERLARLVADQPDATLVELREPLGLDASLSTIDRHLRALKLSFKKRH